MRLSRKNCPGKGKNMSEAPKWEKKLSVFKDQKEDQNGKIIMRNVVKEGISLDYVEWVDPGQEFGIRSK